MATIWQLNSAAKNACFAQWGQFLKSLSVFPSNFMWLFIFSFIWNFPSTLCNPLQTPLLLHFFSKSSRKSMGLIFLTSYSMFCVLFSCHLSRYYIRNILLYVCWYDWLCLLLISSVFILLVTLCYSLFCALTVVGFHTHLVNGLGTFCVLLRLYVWVFKYA